jgi:hypothetical protein
MVSPSEQSTHSASTDSMCIESSLDIPSSDKLKGKEKESVRLESIDTQSLSAAEEGFHIDISIEEQSIRAIGGLKMQPRDTSRPTIDINPPFGDAGHHEQKTTQHSRTLGNIKHPLHDCKYCAPFYTIL